MRSPIQGRRKEQHAGSKLHVWIPSRVGLGGAGKMTDAIAEGRRTFERYAAQAKKNIGRILAERPVYDGVGVKIGDDLTKFPLAYGITRRGELRRFTDLMFETHKHEGIKAVLEIVEDVNFGLPQEAATVITLHQAARIGRKIFFNNRAQPVRQWDSC